jgi:hypothetical protein
MFHYEDSYYDDLAYVELRKYYQKITDELYRRREVKRKTRSMFEGLIFTIDIIKNTVKHKPTLLAVLTVENLSGMQAALKKLLKRPTTNMWSN